MEHSVLIAGIILASLPLAVFLTCARPYDYPYMGWEFVWPWQCGTGRP